MTEQDYIDLISREPLAEMVKEVKDKDGAIIYKHIPKSILQRELLAIYKGNHKWDMHRDTVSKNGMWGKGLLEVKHPVTGEWIHYSGTASLKHEKVMRLNYPNLEAHCMINACKKIGVWFGQTLNINEEDAMPEDLGITENGSEEDSQINEQFVATMKKVVASKTKEEAQEIVNENGFSLNVELKSIINAKPSKPSINGKVN